MEKWREIGDFPGYEVSSEGRVRNMSTGKILAMSVNGNGVVKVSLRRDGKFHTRSVGVLVARAYHGEPPRSFVVIYKDGNSLNVTEGNTLWRQRWFAQERAAQSKRTIPMRDTRVRMESTGVVYDNPLACARAIDGIEKYIILCAGDPVNRRYMGSGFSWVMD